MGLIELVVVSESLVCSVDSNGGVYFVLVLSGLGVFYWDMNVCGVFFGLIVGVIKVYLVRLVLEAIVF